MCALPSFCRTCAGSLCLLLIYCLSIVRRNSRGTWTWSKCSSMSLLAIQFGLYRAGRSPKPAEHTWSRTALDWKNKSLSLNEDPPFEQPSKNSKRNQSKCFLMVFRGSLPEKIRDKSILFKPLHNPCIDFNERWCVHLTDCSYKGKKRRPYNVKACVYLETKVRISLRHQQERLEIQGQRKAYCKYLGSVFGLLTKLTSCFSLCLFLQPLTGCSLGLVE